MIILGIDPGTARMGYGVIEISKSKPKLLVTDVIVTHPDLDMYKRLKYLYKSLNEITKTHSPNVMVIEKLFFNTNAKTAMTVGQARGISMLAAANRNLPLFEYTALEAKLVLTGYGRAGKKEMQEAVKDVLGLATHVKSDDANDAVAMALCFIKKDLANFLGKIKK